MEINESTITIALLAALAVSELLAQVPQVKANSIFQLVYSGLKKVTGRG